MTATGASGAAACPCSTTQINITWAPVSVHRFTAGSDAIPETRVSQGHTAAPLAPVHAVGLGPPVGLCGSAQLRLQAAGPWARHDV